MTATMKMKARRMIGIQNSEAIKMTIVSMLYANRKRFTEEQLEKLINILEDERKRRNLERDDEIMTKKG